jgi:Protocatechuate 3,4-dioxygenase beta subunit
MTQDTYRRPAAGQHPANLSPEYKSTPGRSPRLAPIAAAAEPVGDHRPAARHRAPRRLENDLTKQRSGEPLGERIVVHGRVLDEDGKPIPQALVEIWQCNAAGRYHHPGDQHDAPLDPISTAVAAIARMRTALRIHHHQARRLSVEEPPQCLAAGAHPLLAVRAGLRHAPDHPDVLP